MHLLLKGEKYSILQFADMRERGEGGKEGGAERGREGEGGREGGREGGEREEKEEREVNGGQH